MANIKAGHMAACPAMIMISCSPYWGDVLSNQIFTHLFFELPQVTADNAFMHMAGASKAFFRLVGMI